MEKNLIYVLILSLYISTSRELDLKRFFTNKISQISLVIKGKGTKTYIYGNEPSQVSVNGVIKEKCKTSCKLPEEKNDVILAFNYEIKPCEKMFNGLTSIIQIDLSNFDFSKVTDAIKMFNGCTKLESIIFGNINTKSLEDMQYLFYNCVKLTEIDLSTFDTSHVKNFKYMFYQCSSLISLDLSNFNTEKVEDMSHMFYKCKELQNLNIFSFETSKVERMDYMFYECSKLTSLNISNFKTSNVKKMDHMFSKCDKLYFLDLSNFDISEVTTISYMFYKCNSLIYLNLYSFKYHSSLSKSYLLTDTSPDLKYCIKDATTTPKLLGKKKISNCCDSCFGENIQLDLNERFCKQTENYNNKFCDNENTIHIIYDDEEEEENETEEEDEKKCLELSDSDINTCLENIPEGYYFEDGYYKKCYQNCKKCKGPGDDINHNCIECKEDFKFLNDDKYKNNCYKECPYYYYFENSEEYKCTDIKDCPSDYNKLIKEKNECIENCENDNIYKYIYNNTCYEKCPNGTLNQGNDYICNPIEFYDINEIRQIIIAEKDAKIENLQENLIYGNMDYMFNNASENKEDFVKKEDDVIYQITTSENQKNNSKNNISTLDLGDCEDTLRSIYNISKIYPLIILKIDYYSPDPLIPIIGYEIYHPLNKSKLDLKYCEEILIKLNIPVSIDENKLFKYDPNSDYYTDNCFSHTTENGTAIILNDRKKEFSDNKLSLCENNCYYIGYNINTKKSSCNCNVKNKLDLISEIVDNENKLSNIDYNSTTSSSNIVTLKCTKTLFTKEGLKNNISSYVILFIIFYFILSILFYIKCGYPLMDDDIKEILNSKKDKNKGNHIFKISKRKKGKQKKKHSKKTIAKFPQKMPNECDNNFIELDNQNKNNIKKPEKKIKNNFKFTKKNSTGENIKSSTNKKNKTKYNDFELNLINYKIALLYDKRTFSQIYLSLLRKKHPIIFAFCPIKDYNSIIIKSSMFLLIFAVYYAINFSFFNEDIIHKIYEKGGKYDVIYFLPKIIISFVISHLIGSIIKFIFLSERNLMEIKNQKNLEESSNIVSKIKRNLVIKYIIYFISGLVFLVFFWLLLSSFGAVYQNTQIFIFENTLISFCISFFYPFIINFLPCIFRILALNSKSKNKECIYIFSYILQFI